MGLPSWKGHLPLLTRSVKHSYSYGITHFSRLYVRSTRSSAGAQAGIYGMVVSVISFQGVKRPAPSL